MPVDPEVGTTYAKVSGLRIDKRFTYLVDITLKFVPNMQSVSRITESMSSVLHKKLSSTIFSQCSCELLWLCLCRPQIELSTDPSASLSCTAPPQEAAPRCREAL
ncbi:hypothetical protein E2C01_033118 [Portunus trituberculatus]|uniref:Uncharacterized protein n=1 Tax=Portunus trituberculatus TaxID=210409 RepID=A0A5B7F348_PORTR|nr:hypothetical protein [Portunus trituberculatus]